MAPTGDGRRALGEQSREARPGPWVVRLGPGVVRAVPAPAAVRRWALEGWVVWVQPLQVQPVQAQQPPVRAPERRPAVRLLARPDLPLIPATPALVRVPPAAVLGVPAGVRRWASGEWLQVGLAGSVLARRSALEAPPVWVPARPRPAAARLTPAVVRAARVAAPARRSGVRVVRVPRQTASGVVVAAGAVPAGVLPRPRAAWPDPARTAGTNRSVAASRRWA